MFGRVTLAFFIILSSSVSGQVSVDFGEYDLFEREYDSEWPSKDSAYTENGKLKIIIDLKDKQIRIKKNHDFVDYINLVGTYKISRARILQEECLAVTTEDMLDGFPSTFIFTKKQDRFGIIVIGSESMLMFVGKGVRVKIKENRELPITENQ